MNESQRQGKAGRFGIQGYARLFAVVFNQPTDAAGLVDRGLIGAAAARNFMANLHDFGMVRILRWAARPGRPFAPVYTAKPGPDATMPERRPSGKLARCPSTPPRPDGRDTVELMLFFRLYEALLAPVTAMEIGEETEITILTVRQTLKALHEARVIHIAEWFWRQGGGEPVARYMWGREPDALRPCALSKVEKQRRYRERRHMRDLVPTLPDAFAAMAVQCLKYSQEAANDPIARRRA
jgi:hypothetical protein